MQHVEELKQRVQTAHDAGLKCFAGTDMILLPKKLIAKIQGRNLRQTRAD